MEKVAIYLRKSREDERNESEEESLDRHERMLLKLCKERGYEVIKIYKEIQTGTSINKRKEFLRLIEDTYDNLYDGIVVVELSRLTRGGIDDSTFVYNALKNTNTKLITPAEIIDPGSYDTFDDYEANLQKDLWDFECFFNNYEAKTIINRFTRGRHQAQREGYFIGTNVSFGYQKKRIGKGYVLVPDENEEIVREVFNRYNSGQKIGEIRNWLNEINASSPYFNKETKWDYTRVRRILINKVYLGYIRAQTSSLAKIKYIKGRHKPIIDIDTFNKAQLLMQENNQKQIIQEVIDPFQNLLYCSCCKSQMRLRVLNVPNYEKYRYECNNEECNNRINKVDFEHIFELNFKDFIIDKLKNKMNSCLIDRKENNPITNALFHLLDKYKNDKVKHDRILKRMNDKGIEFKKEKDINLYLEEIEEITKINIDKYKNPKRKNEYLKKYIDVIWVNENSVNIESNKELFL